jgi:hypothetical protein
MNVYFLWLSSHGLFGGSPAQWNGSLESVWLARSRVDWHAEQKETSLYHLFARVIGTVTDRARHVRHRLNRQMGDLDAKLERRIVVHVVPQQSA